MFQWPSGGLLSSEDLEALPVATSQIISAFYFRSFTKSTCEPVASGPENNRYYLDSQVAGNKGPLYPKVDHYWFKVAHNSEPLALQVGC